MPTTLAPTAWPLPLLLCACAVLAWDEVPKAEPWPEDALVVPSWDTQWTMPAAVEGIAEPGAEQLLDPATPLSLAGQGTRNWVKYPIPGYWINGFSVPHGSLESEGGQGPVQTCASGLGPGRHHVYLRYYGTLIQAGLRGVHRQLLMLTPGDADAKVTIAPEPGTSRVSNEYYLGFVDGDTVEVLIDDRPEGGLHTRSYYDGLLIRSSAQETAREPALRRLLAESLDRLAARVDVARVALRSASTSAPAFDAKRAELAAVEQRLAETRQRLAAATDPHELNLARRAVAELARAVYDPVRGRRLRRDQPEPAFDVTIEPWQICEVKGLLGHAGFDSDIQIRTWNQALAAPLDGAGDGMVVFPVTTLSSQVIPTLVPAPQDVGRKLTTFVAPGQVEPLSFAVLAARDLPGLHVSATDLRSGRNVLAASALDIKAAIPWWTGEKVGHTGEPIGPLACWQVEVLLYDASLITAGIHEPRNHYPRAPVLADGPPLKPVDLAGGTLRQFWLVLEVPPGQPAGTYQGSLVLSAADTRAELALTVEVLPFELPPPMLDYGFYYQPDLAASDEQALASGRSRTRAQVRNELRSMRRYGVVYPAFSVDADTFRPMLELLREAGMPTDRVFINATPAPDTVRQYVAIARELGFGELHVYLTDEAGDDVRRRELDYCRQVHEGGAKTFVADNHGNALRILREALDVPNLAPDTFGSGALEYYHGLGRKCYTYMRPNAEGSRPAAFRRNYGIGLWQMGYDGAMPWTWTLSNVWRNEQVFPWFGPGDSILPFGLIQGLPWRLMSYRTADGFVDTIKAEGFRAAVNDVRYLTALVQAIDLARRQGRADAVREAQAFLDRLKATLPYDFQSIRRQLAEQAITTAGGAS